MREALRRASPVPALVRVAIFLTGLAALIVAAPPEVVSMRPLVGAAVAVAVMAALLPGSAWVTGLVLVAVTGWVVATAGYGQPITVARVLLLAGLLYLLHSLATLGAALPYDAVVGPDVWVRWLARTLLVVAASSLLSVAVLAGIAEVAGGGVYLAATLAGLAVAAGLAAVLSRSARD